MFPLITAIQQAFQLPDNTVITGWLTEDQRNPDFFISVNLTNCKEIGISRREFDGINEIETVRTTCISTVDINCFGNHAIAMATKLRTVFQSSYFQFIFRRMQCGLVSVSDIRNLTATVASSYEERGQVTLELSHENVVKVPLYRINSSTQYIHEG